MIMIVLHYYNITHAKIILTEQNAWLIIYISKNKIKMHGKYQYNRLDAAVLFKLYFWNKKQLIKVQWLKRAKSRIFDFIIKINIIFDGK